MAILQDLSGPKIRTGKLHEEYVNLVRGHKLVLTTKEIIGDEKRISVNYALLPKELKAGDIILVEDAKRKLRVDKVNGTEIETTILRGGLLGWRRGVNIPGANLSVCAITEKDKKDLEFGLKHKVDFVALSFVRNPKDIDLLRKILKQKKSKAKIVVKVETPQAVEAIDEIIEKADVVMVARGDLAIEVGAEEIPFIQKTIIKKCNRAGKPVITATQLLESMMHSDHPSRSDISDIANAVIDGSDALMLSGETALGEYPAEAVRVMVRVAKNAQGYLRGEK